MKKGQNGHPDYIVTAARLGAWQRYLHECNGKDIAPEEYLPLQGRDIYTKASNGVAQALRNLMISGATTADARSDDWGNQYQFAIKQGVPLGDSLLHAATIYRDIEADVPDCNGNLARRKVRLLARTHGTDNLGPVMMLVSDSQPIEDLLASMEWRTILSLSPHAIRVRQFHMGGQGKPIIDINGKCTQQWRLFRLEIHDQYPYPELGQHVDAAVRNYLTNPYNVEYSKGAAARAYVPASRAGASSRAGPS